MKRAPKNFPRHFTTSSAAYRAIRQYEEKIGEKSGLTMTTVAPGKFIVAKSSVMTVEQFSEKKPNVVYDKIVYRHFPDGPNGEGFYELKTGDRRRPNSKFVATDTVYNDLISEKCEI